MPLENFIDDFRRKCFSTEIKFVLFPKKCYITDKLLWLEYAYKQTAAYIGPGDVFLEFRWYDKNEFLIAKLKGLV